MLVVLDPIVFVRTAYQKSPWLVISVAGHALLFAVLGAIVVSRQFVKHEEPLTSIALAPRNAALAELVLPPEPIDIRAVPANEEVEIVPEDDVTYFTTEPQPDEDLHRERGDFSGIDDLPPGASSSIGVGLFKGEYSSRPSVLGAHRGGGGGGGVRGTVRQGGPTQQTERAVLEGLRWLIRHQNDDGSWGGAELRSRCTPGKPCIPVEHALTEHFDEGLTGLALLCFLGAGLDHDSKQIVVDTAMGKRYSVGEVVKNGLKWLRSRQREDGSFAATRGLLYNDILATLALTEAYGLSRHRAWKESAERGIEFILAAQKPHPDGAGLWGWRYTGRQEIDDALAAGTLSETDHYVEMREADISVTCWAVMALKSAELSGIAVPHEAYDGAMAFTRWVSLPDGRVGYQEPGQAGEKILGRGDHYDYHLGTMSALSMLVRTFAEKNVEDPFLEAAAKQIVQDLPAVSKDRLSVDYYYWYYAALALNQFDGPDSPRKTNEYWGRWNEAMKDALLELQDQSSERDVCARGGWLVDDRWSHAGGALYNTAINTLTLQVYYRYENAFGATRR